MRHYVVVAESRHDRYDKVMGAVAMATVSKDVGKPRDHVLILLYDLLLRPRYVLVIVVSRRVARPYDKVDVVLDIVLDPLERLVNERIRRVAASRLCAVESSGPAFAVACCFSGGARICLVEWVRVEVCRMTLAAAADAW